MDTSGETHRLREEVRYLRRRLQYLQSVSTVFRQRISLLLREVAEDPSRVRDLHAAYTALLSETALAEKQDSFDPRFDTGGVSSPNTTNPSAAGGGDSTFQQQQRGGYTDPVKAREDVRRAHHLCVILQERNELKRRELDLEHMNRELLNRLEEYEKPSSSSAAFQSQSSQNRNVSATSPSSYNNYQQQQQQRNINSTTSNNSFLASLQQQQQQQQANTNTNDLIDSPRGGSEVVENQNQNNNNNNNNNNIDDDQKSTTSSVIPGASMLRSLGGGGGGGGSSSFQNENNNNINQVQFVALQKQNAFLKSRVQRLKSELDESMQLRQETVTDLQQSIDSLSCQSQSLKTDIARNQREVAESNRAKLEAQKELLFQKSREELLVAKLDAATGGGGMNSSRAGGSMVPFSPGGGGDSQMVQVLSQQLQERESLLRENESKLCNLEDHLHESEAKRAAKDVEVAALGAQIKGLRARLETFDNERSTSQVQQSLVADVHDRLLSAVVDIQRGANSDSLAKSITDVSGKLDRLEALELQLRQKEDMLALADDEVARSHTMQQQLKEALAAFSPLFLQLPKSADALERLVIERDELLNEIRTSTSEGRAADLDAVEGRVELRSLQTNSQRGGGNNSSTGGGNSNVSMMVPPLPPLLDIRAEAASDRSNSNANVGNNSQSRNRQQQQNQHQQGPNIDAIPLTHLTPNDISATFRLFAPPTAESSSDIPVSGEQLRLCFAALGLPYPLNVNPQEFSMTEAQLISHVAQKQNNINNGGGNTAQ